MALRSQHRYNYIDRVGHWQSFLLLIPGKTYKLGTSETCLYIIPRVETQVLASRVHARGVPTPHGKRKTGKMTKKNPCQGKHREFGNFAKTQFKHKEFGLLKL